MIESSRIVGNRRAFAMYPLGSAQQPMSALISGPDVKSPFLGGFQAIALGACLIPGRRLSGLIISFSTVGSAA